jgi:hypothetical protein
MGTVWRRAGWRVGVSILVSGAALAWPAFAGASSARSGSVVLSVKQVAQAFQRSGLTLVVLASQTNPANLPTGTIPSLMPLAPPSRYDLGVIVYPTVVEAERAFRSGASVWRRDDDAVAIVKNVLITVAPSGTSQGHFAMPARVTQSISRMNHG